MKWCKRHAAIFLVTVLTCSCTVGPNYTKPSIPTPPAFRNAPEQPAQSAESIADLPWWEVFRDPVLQKLIRTALERNYDLKIASEQIIAARAQAGIVRANQLPQAGAQGYFMGGKDPAEGQTVPANSLGVLASVSYQLDLFGGLRRATEAARATMLASEEARRTVVMTLVSDVATDYYQLLALDRKLEVARDTLQTQERAVRLTEMRVERSVATKADMLQAQQLFDAANSQIPDIERQIRRTEDAIGILLGGYPEDVPRGAVLNAQYVAPNVPAGLTSALLERRPDIRRAEKNLIASNAQIGVAKAQFFPQIPLTAGFGRDATFMSLMNTQGNVWSYGATLAQPLFQGGRLKANLQVAESQDRQALLTYMQTIQQAFGEVSDALIDYQKYREVRAHQEQYVRDLEDSVRIANMRYSGGITTYLEVLDAQRALFAQQLVLADSHQAEIQSVVQLYRALGGGWQQ